MKQLLIFAFILGFFGKAYANSCNYMDATNSSGTAEVMKLSEEIGEFVYPEEKLFGCSWDQQMRYYEELKRTADRIDVLLYQIKHYDTSSLSKSNKKKVRRVEKNLSCIKNKFLDKMEIHCESCTEMNAYVTRVKVPILGTIHNPTKIHVCTALMDNYDGPAIGGILLHELSHKCGTNDIEYFITPFDYNYVSASSIDNWDRNADHFEFWYHNSFCIPGIDCR